MNNPKFRNTTLVCPSLESPESASYTYGTRAGNHASYYGNAGSNKCKWYWENVGPYPSNATTGRLASSCSVSMNGPKLPDNFSLMCDSRGADGNQTYYIGRGNQDEWGVIDPRHGKFANSAFMDGSARAININEMNRLGFTNYFDAATNTKKLTTPAE